MAKGSVRKKGKKWYYRFYVEDESGNRVQKEFPGTESKSETEALLRKAMENYENTQFIAKAKNITLGELLDMWIAEEVMPSNRSNGTVRNYSNTVKTIKKYPVSKRKLLTIKVEHLQKFFDAHSSVASHKSTHNCATVLRSAFRYAVFPKQFINFNPMPYVNVRDKDTTSQIFQDEIHSKFVTVSDDQYSQIVKNLETSGKPALLAIQIAYFSGLRLGEVCALTWQDIDLENQCMTIRRSMAYNDYRKKTEIGPTKGNKIRTVDFGDNLTAILKSALKEQRHNRKSYGSLYKKNYCIPVREKNRVHYDIYDTDQNGTLPEDHISFDLVCTREDGRFIRPQYVDNRCRRLSKEIDGLKGFHFHSLRHTYTSNLLSKGASPKDVQELLGHSDVNLTLNVYAHSARESKRNSAKLLDSISTA